MKRKLEIYTTMVFILAICLGTAILQALDFSGFLPTTKNTIAILSIALYILAVVRCIRAGILRERLYDFIIVGALLLRAYYVLNTGIYDRQHDVGNITSLSDGLVNGGHLGYIEYFVKNRHMPDFNPFEVLSYYHPPLHHIIGAVLVCINLAFKVDYTAAFENVQILTLFYSAITMVFAKKILEIIPEKENRQSTKTGTAIALALVCFHPAMTYLAGSVNNDMLTIMLEVMVIYYSLCFIRDKSLKNLMMIAVILGFAAISKMNSVIFALPIGIIFLMHFYGEIKKGNMGKWFGRYLLFGFVCGGIGLSFTLRNALRFHEKPGILSADSNSLQYMGIYSLLTRLGIPDTLDWSYPFHSEYAKASKNVWLILFKTSVFAEVRPDVGTFGLWLARIVLIAAILLYIIISILIISVSIKFIKGGNKEEGIFCLSAFGTIILTYVAFVIKYPYTCSCDFRYIAISLIFGSIAIACSNSCKRVLWSFILAFLILSNVFLYNFCIF